MSALRDRFDKKKHRKLFCMNLTLHGNIFRNLFDSFCRTCLSFVFLSYSLLLRIHIKKCIIAYSLIKEVRIYFISSCGLLEIHPDLLFGFLLKISNTDLRASIHVYLRIGFSSWSTLTLLDNRLISWPSHVFSKKKS